VTSLERILKIVIDDASAGQRLDKILASHPQIQSRTKAAVLCDGGLVTSNGKALKASAKLVAGQSLVITLPEPVAATDLKPLDLPLQLLYQDDDIVVVDKPAGLVVHPSYGHNQDTLVNVLLHHVGNLSMGFQENRPGIVHRLDKDTSGILVVAKNDVAHAFLAKQFREKTVHRVYEAAIWGSPKSSGGTARSHLRRHPTDRKRFASAPDGTVPKGKLAITHWRNIRTSHSGFSLVECRLETGRTHQIRVHLSEMGHPIVGDALYGGVARAKNLKSVALRGAIANLNRIALHARELAFVHPRTGKMLSFVSPWPVPMPGLLESMGLVDV
jgi:23S rRNA pseudouridine1911/1915/1917 synthase